MKETDILVLRDNAKAELMQIKSVEDGMTHLNKLITFQTWVRAEKKDAELQNIVAEQKLRTQRILGELIKEGQRNGEIATQEAGINQHGHTSLVHPKTLDQIGLSRNQSSSFQKIASIPTDKFEAFIKEKKQAVNEAIGELTTAGILKLANNITHTYSESNRLAGYFNDKYARLVRAYAYNKNMDVSDVIVLMCRKFIDGLSDIEISSMTQVYLRDFKMGEVK